MTDFNELLLKGFDLQYIPSEAAEAVTTQQPVIQEIIQGTESEVLGEAIQELLTRAEAIANSLDNTPLPSTAQALRQGSPTLDEIEQLRQYDEYHAEQDPLPLVKEAATYIALDLQDVQNDPVFQELQAARLSDDPLDPATRLTEYFTLKGSFADEALTSLEMATRTSPLPTTSLGELLHSLAPDLVRPTAQSLGSELFPIDSSEVEILTQAEAIKQPTQVSWEFQDPLAETMGMDNPLGQARGSLQECVGYLRKLRSVLKMERALCALDIRQTISSVRNYARFRFHRALGTLKSRISQQIYQDTLGPLVKQVMKGDRKTTTKLPILRHIHDDVFSFLQQRITMMQHEMAALAAEDQEFFNKTAAHGKSVRRRSDLDQMIQFLDRAILSIDPLVSDPDPLPKLLNQLDRKL